MIKSLVDVKAMVILPNSPVAVPNSTIFRFSTSSSSLTDFCVLRHFVLIISGSRSTVEPKRHDDWGSLGGFEGGGQLQVSLMGTGASMDVSNKQAFGRIGVEHGTRLFGD